MYPILSVPGPLDRNDQGVVIPWLWEVRAHAATVPERSPLAKQQEPAACAPGHRAWRWNPEQASAWAAVAGPGVAAFVGAGWCWGSHCSRND